MCVFGTEQDCASAQSVGLLCILKFLFGILLQRKTNIVKKI